MLDPRLLRTELPRVAEQLKRRGLVLDTARFEALEARPQGRPGRGPGPAGPAQHPLQGHRQGQGLGPGHSPAARRGR